MIQYNSETSFAVDIGLRRSFTSTCLHCPKDFLVPNEGVWLAAVYFFITGFVP